MKQGVKYFLIEVTLGKNKMWRGWGRGRQDVNNQQCSFSLRLIDDPLVSLDEFTNGLSYFTFNKYNG